MRFHLASGQVVPRLSARGSRPPAHPLHQNAKMQRTRPSLVAFGPAREKTAMDEGLLGEVRMHDARVARSGIPIWTGAEPTFTQAQSQHPCWLSEAASGEKEAHARALLAALAPRLGGEVQLLRVPGR